MLLLLKASEAIIAAATTPVDADDTAISFHKARGSYSFY
jgi:hypothetical protein